MALTKPPLELLEHSSDTTMADHHYYGEDSDDDDSHSRKRKRSKKNKKDNPLSQARGKQQSHENIWFKRTGAGFHLFVQYYAGQPSGTVADTTMTIPIIEAPQQKQQKGGGLSRAAKRRKKKKKPPSASKEEKQETTNNQSAAPISTTASSFDTHPLLQAMKKTAESNPKALSLQSFLEHMARPLPVTFRIRRSVPKEEVSALRDQIKDTFANEVQPLAFGNEWLFQAPHCSKLALKKQHPQLHAFLVEGSQNGTLARQELGSMLPLLALERAGCVKGRILDLCASPGSKTLQALELVVSQKKSSTAKRILANDLSQGRLSTLQDAIQRSGVPNAHKIGYSCHDARHLSTQNEWHTILCDVPCSGDGTLRKDFHIVPQWKPACGQALHATQLPILQRALQLLKVGGVVCYSTCSLNPLENEAVVAAALQHYCDGDNDAAEILEFPNIPGFFRRPGLSTWRVADMDTSDNRNNHNDDDEEDDETPRLVWYDQPPKNNHNMPKTWWPPIDTAKWEESLRRCTRLWPQDHDSGGFFLALIRKNR